MRLIPTLLQHPAAVDGKSHHRQNVVSLLSSYHHVNFAVWVLPFSNISLYLLIDPTYNMEVIFFLFGLNGVNIHFFSPSKLSDNSQYQTQRLTQQKQIISCSVIGRKFPIFPEESLMFTPLYFPLCCLHVSLQSNSEQFISLITAHSPRGENKPVHEKAARTQVSVLPPSPSLSVSVKD